MTGENGCRCSVKIKNLSVKKGDQLILHNIGLTANHGEILALIGRNGAGKTTLLKAIMGQIPYQGTIAFFDAAGNRITKPRIGYVPQTLIFDRSTPVTVADLFCANLGYTPVWLGHRRRQFKQAKEQLGKVGGEGLLHKSIGRLSGGELQRVLLAFALDPMPDMLLLDEPVSAVDRRGTGVFYELVTSLRSEYHMPIILVSHDLGHVRRYATQAAFLDGTGVTQGDVAKILGNPRVREAFGLDMERGGI
jgi:zinc transport system ATP-binding protein